MEKPTKRGNAGKTLTSTLTETLKRIVLMVVVIKGQDLGGVT